MQLTRRKQWFRINTVLHFMHHDWTEARSKEPLAIHLQIIRAQSNFAYQHKPASKIKMTRICYISTSKRTQRLKTEWKINVHILDFLTIKQEPNLAMSKLTHTHKQSSLSWVAACPVTETATLFSITNTHIKWRSLEFCMKNVTKNANIKGETGSECWTWSCKYTPFSCFNVPYLATKFTHILFKISCFRAQYNTTCSFTTGFVLHHDTFRRGLALT